MGIEDGTPTVEGELLPCPFCGGEPYVRTFETESLWSHDQVTYTKVSCDECDIAFATEPGHETQSAAAWNTRVVSAPLGEPGGEGFSALRPSASVPTEREVRLVLAARAVAFGDGPDPAAIRELDAASEAYAADVPWEDEPEATQ